MAERLSQYPMLPNFNPGLMQSQQQQQQQPHVQSQQQQQQQQDPSMQNFPDQARMWQQVQHLQHYRPGGADINQQQSNAQASGSLFCHRTFFAIRPIYLRPVPLGTLLLYMWAALLTIRFEIPWSSTHILSRCSHRKTR
jgi:hypothetical protein